MARLNVHVPDELAERARTTGLNVSALTQIAISLELERRALDAWLNDLPVKVPTVSHDDALVALEDARNEFAEPRD